MSREEIERFLTDEGRKKVSEFMAEILAERDEEKLTTWYIYADDVGIKYIEADEPPEGTLGIAPDGMTASAVCLLANHCTHEELLRIARALEGLSDVERIGDA